jgi:CheY-like chemotaxis protein
MSMSFPTRYSGFHPHGCHILLVEDNPAEARLFEISTLEADNSLSLATVSDGAEALDYVFQRGRYQDARPCTLIVLDLNLPCVDGFEVLKKLKGDITASAIPIIVLSSSAEPGDVQRAYQQGANAYLRKPTDANQMQAMARSFVHYWCELVRLPEA